MAIPISSKQRKSDTMDCLRSSAQKSNKTIKSSLRLWHTTLASACSKTHFPQSYVNTNHLLYNTPSIPAGQIDEISQDSSLLFNGFSQWRIDAANTCVLLVWDEKFSHSEGRNRSGPDKYHVKFHKNFFRPGSASNLRTTLSQMGTTYLR